MESRVSEGYGNFWKTWGILLLLTAIMVFVDVMHWPRVLLLGVLLVAMLTKASLIAAEFMDLRHESVVVAFAVGFSLLFFGALLYGLMVPDGHAVLHGGR